MISESLYYYREYMNTAIAHTRNINIESSAVLLDTTSTEKSSYQYTKFFYCIITNTSTIYTEITH